MIFDHFNIDVPAQLLTPTKTFYEEVFGLTAGFRPNLSRAGYWLYYQEKAILHLFERNTSLAEEGTSYLDHVAFQLTDIESFKVKLNQHNIAFRTIVNNEIHITQLFIVDPAGVKIECIFQH